MAEVSNFVARWYANVNDDIRQKVVEEGWYGRSLSGNEMRTDVEASIASYSQTETPQHFAQVYGRDPHVPGYMDGMDARGVENPNGETVRNVTQDFYGYKQGDEARSLQADAETLYGYDDARQAEISDLYGSDFRQIESADLYGYGPEQDDSFQQHEQE